jgi:hypothetical protein
MMVMVMTAGLGILLAQPGHTQNATDADSLSPSLQGSPESRGGFDDYQRLFPEEGGGGGSTVDLAEISEEINQRATEGPTASPTPLTLPDIRPDFDLYTPEPRLRFPLR